MHNFGVLAQVLLTGESRFLCLCDFKELGVAKRSRSTTSARSALRHPWSIIARTNFLKAATNLNVVQPKLFQASRQDDHRFSHCTVSVIQILDDADGAFRILGAELRTALSATTMFADKPHSLWRSCLQLPHSRLGYPRSGLSRSDLVQWHFASFRCRAAIWSLSERSGHRAT